MALMLETQALAFDRPADSGIPGGPGRNGQSGGQSALRVRGSPARRDYLFSISWGFPRPSCSSPFICVAASPTTR
jgi:hypothetical protein